MPPKVLAAFGAVAIAVCAGAESIAAGKTDKPVSSPTSVTRPIYVCASPTRESHYVGLSVFGFPPERSKLTALEKKFQLWPSAISMYVSLGMKLDMSAVTEVCAQGAFPIIEIDSDDIPLSKVANGDYDAVLTAYAEDLKALDYPVGINFDHEFNSPVWDWGAKEQNATNFIAAWRHIVNLFKESGC
jgi:hypothetical protein